MSIRERIIEDATAMFVAYGLKSVRMDDIAAQMGVSKRTIYETFGDKEALVTACVRFFFSQKHAYTCQKSAGAANIIEELMINLDNDDEMVKKSLILAADLRRFYPKIYRQIQDESLESGMREIRELLRKGVEQGIFISQIDSDLTVSIFFDLMQTMLNRYNPLAPVSEVPMPDMIRFCIIFFVRGISTKHGIGLIDDYLAKKYNIN